MATRKVRYVGPIDEVVVPLPDGGSVFVERNHQAEFPEDIARNLLTQADWEKVDPPKSDPKKDDKAEG